MTTGALQQGYFLGQSWVVTPSGKLTGNAALGSVMQSFPSLRNAGSPHQPDLDWTQLAFWTTYLGCYVICLLEAFGRSS